MKDKEFDWLRGLVHVGAWITFLVFVLIFLLDRSTFYPIRSFEHQTGKAALIFLILSLACTPISIIFGWKSLAKRRKALGLYGFMFAAIHVLVFLWLDYGFQINTIWQVLINSIYLWVGLTAFLLLLTLAITSYKKIQAALKKNWKRLHRLVYLIVPLVVLHFILVQKGNLLSLQGDLVEPLIYGGVVLFFLALRNPPIKHWLTNLRIKLQARLR